MYNRDPLEYYQVLEVSPDADARTIKLSYRDRAKEWHPDYNKAENAMEHFQKISVAYDVLQDEEKRLTYDLLACVYGKDDFPIYYSGDAAFNITDDDTTLLSVPKCRAYITYVVKNYIYVYTDKENEKFIFNLETEEATKQFYDKIRSSINQID